MTRRSHRIHKNNQQEILDRLQQLQEQLDEIKKYVLQNDSKPVSKTRRKTRMLTPDDYQTFFSWQEKIVFILKYRNRPLLSYEIVSFMNDFDTVFQYKWTELDKVKILSTHITRAVKMRDNNPI